MGQIKFELPDFKKSIDDFRLEIERKFIKNSINVSQKEAEKGLVFISTDWYLNELAVFKHRPSKKNNFVIISLWIEMHDNQAKEVNRHICSIIDSNTEFEFKLKKGSNYKGFIITLTYDWIIKNIYSDIMKNYFMSIIEKEVKMLFFYNDDFCNWLYTPKKLKWQLYVECWHLMGVIFDKIGENIQRERLELMLENEKYNFDSLQTFIVNNIHKPTLEIQKLLNTYNTRKFFLDKENYTKLSQFILEIKMLKSVELLKEQKLSVSEVSETVGFSKNKVSQFTLAFKKQFGISPMDYRQVMKERANITVTTF